MAATAPQRFLNLNILKHCISARPQRQENKNQHKRVESSEEIKSYPSGKKRSYCALVSDTDFMQIRLQGQRHKLTAKLLGEIPQQNQKRTHRGRVERSGESKSYPARSVGASWCMTQHGESQDIDIAKGK